MADQLTQRSFSALGWGYAGFVTRAVAGFLGGLVLARLLGPKPFGQVAAAALVFGFANQLADGGFNLALVQCEELDQRDIRFAFTLQLIVGGMLTLLCVLSAPHIARAFHDAAITRVLRYTALLFLLQSVGQVSAAILKRQLAFRRLQIAQIGSYVAGYMLVGIVLAFRGWGVWSLVAAQLVQCAVYSLTAYAQVPYSLIPCINKRSFRLVRFGAKVTGANILNWSLSNLDNAVVGSSFGSGALGLYSRAFNTVSTPADAVVSTWQQVLFASCSRAGNRKPVLRRAYLASLSAITLITLPVFWSVAVCAPLVVTALYGKQWSGAAPLLVPLAVAITINGVMALAGPILGSVDLVKYELRAQLISLIVAVACFLTAAHYSAVAVAWSVLGVYCVRFFAVTLPALQLLNLGWIDVLKAIRGAVAVACITALIVRETDFIASGMGLSPFTALAIAFAVGMAMEFALVLVAGEYILAPELRTFLLQVAPSSPVGLSRLLEKIATGRPNRRSTHDDLESTAGRSTTRPILFVATMMTAAGDTGVQTHFTEFRRELERTDIGTELLTPHGLPRVLLVATHALARIVALFRSKSATLYTWILIDQFLLKCSMRRSLPRYGRWTVYAQCPRSAFAAMSLRRNSSQTVAMIVHFNRSQGEEMSDRGWIRRGGLIDRAARRIERKTLLGVDRVVYCSDFMRSYLTTRVAGLAQRPSMVIPNFVTPPARALDGPAGDIITIGSVEPRKNQHAILRIVAEAGRLGRIYTLTIVGSGELDLPLRELAFELGIAAQVTFAGHVGNASRLLHRHRIYVHAAKMENLPIVLIEALSAGLPVMAPAVGGIPEIFRDGDEGHFWNPDDVTESAAQLIANLDDEQKLRRMSENALRTYNDRFRSDEIARRLYRFVAGEDFSPAATDPPQLVGPCSDTVLSA